MSGNQQQRRQQQQDEQDLQQLKQLIPGLGSANVSQVGLSILISDNFLLNLTFVLRCLLQNMSALE